MAVLLIADVNDGQLATDSVAKTLSAVKRLGEVHVLIAGTAAAAATGAGRVRFIQMQAAEGVLLVAMS